MNSKAYGAQQELTNGASELQGLARQLYMQLTN